MKINQEQDRRASATSDIRCRLVRAAQRGAALLLCQAPDSPHSETIVSTLAPILAVLNVTSDDLQVFDARGKTAIGTRSEDVIRSLIQAVDGDDVGVLLIHAGPRPLCSDPAISRLLDALSANGAFLVVGGVTYDLSNLVDRLMLDLSDTIAAFENRQFLLRRGSARISSTSDSGSA